MKLDRRKFVSSLRWLGVAGLAPLPAMAAVAEKVTATGDILKTGPYLQSSLGEQVTVRWITSRPCLCWVEYGTAENNLDKKACTVDAGLVEAYNTVQAITLKGLQPGQQYFYRIHSRTIEKFDPYKVIYGDTHTSAVHSFTTPSPQKEEASFLVFNDIHDRPASFAQLMQLNGSEPYDFVVLNGDMFDYQTDEKQLVDHLLDPLSKLFSATTPFYLARGNHETRGKYARQLPGYFNHAGQEPYFSFQCGPVYVIVLDSGEDKDDEVAEYAGLVSFNAYREQQAVWLQNEVRKKAFRKAKYKVVFSHIPLFYSPDYGALHCRKLWGPILNKAKIDLLISGHTHHYGVHQPKKGEHNYPIVIGGGPHKGKRTLIKVKADKKALVLTMLNDGGVEVGRVTC